MRKQMGSTEGEEGCDRVITLYRKHMYDEMVNMVLDFEKNNHKRACIYAFQDRFIHNKLKGG